MLRRGLLAAAVALAVVGSLGLLLVWFLLLFDKPQGTPAAGGTALTWSELGFSASWIPVLMLVLFGLFVFLGLALFVLWLVFGPMLRESEEPEWRRVARFRYAAGEISREEYLQIVRTAAEKRPR